MTTEEFLDYMNSGRPVTANSPVHETMHRLSQEAIRITMSSTPPTTPTMKSSH